MEIELNHLNVALGQFLPASMTTFLADDDTEEEIESSNDQGTLENESEGSPSLCTVATAKEDASDNEVVETKRQLRRGARVAKYTR
jgi:hypothetical protein